MKIGGVVVYVCVYVHVCVKEFEGIYTDLKDKNQSIRIKITLTHVKLK